MKPIPLIRTHAWVLLALLLPTGSAFAKPPYTVAVTPFVQAQLGQKEQEFRQFLDQNLSFYMLRLGVGLAADDVVVSVSGDWSIRDAQVSEEEEFGAARREELDFSIGYRLSPAWNVFAGYKFGETRIDLRVRDPEPGSSSTLRNRFEESGPYLGGAWQHRFEQAGVLSLSMAYAWLNAVNVLDGTADDPEEGDAPEFDDFVGRINADSAGYSLGLRWSMPLTDWLSYQAGLKWQRYEQRVNQAGFRIQAQETFTELGMGVIYRF